MANVTIRKILSWEVVLVNCRDCCHLSTTNSTKLHISLNPISQVNSEKFHMLSMLELFFCWLLHTYSVFMFLQYQIQSILSEEEKYVLTNDKFCRRNYNLESTNLSSAKEECKQNPSCVGFYHRCGRGRQFKYCKTNSKIAHSSCGSKLYMKGIVRFLCKGFNLIIKTIYISTLS